MNAGGPGAFWDGVVHVATTPPRSLIMVALALLAGLGGPDRGRWLAPVLSCAWLAGGALGMTVPAGGELPWAVTLSYCLAGILVAVNACPPRPWFAGIACAAGLIHGYAGGARIAGTEGRMLTLIGESLTVLFVVTLATALTLRLRTGWTRIALRVVGSWIAAVGFLMLGWLARGKG